MITSPLKFPIDSNHDKRVSPGLRTKQLPDFLTPGHHVWPSFNRKVQAPKQAKRGKLFLILFVSGRTPCLVLSRSRLQGNIVFTSPCFIFSSFFFLFLCLFFLGKVLDSTRQMLREELGKYGPLSFCVGCCNSIMVCYMLR